MPLAMSREEVLRWLPHRHPFLFVDEVVTIEPGVRAEGRKYVLADEAYFAGHFPGNPVMPGVLMCEALAQLACILAFKSRGAYHNEPVYLMAMNQARFRRMVKPGETLTLLATVKKNRKTLWVFECVAKVGDEIAVECEVMAGIGS